MVTMSFGFVKVPLEVPTKKCWLAPHQENRLLITFDKDFRQLVFQKGSQASEGVILFRISQLSSVVTAERVQDVLISRNDWMGHFSVVDDLSVRMRPLNKVSLGG